MDNSSMRNGMSDEQANMIAAAAAARLLAPPASMSDEQVTGSMVAAVRPEGVPGDALALSDDGGLCKRILTAGDPSGGTPFAGAKVEVHYTGTLLADGSKFDSSHDRAGNFSFTIGTKQVIKGWDVGVATMHKGEKAELYCRSDYAYGDSGSPPKIPGGATLKFEVELLSWAKDRAKMSAAEKIDEASVLKADATTKFKAGEFAAARSVYDEAVRWMEPEKEFAKEEEPVKSAAMELLVSCLLNSSQCSLKLSDWPTAAARCTTVLKETTIGTTRAGLAPASKVKAFFRRGCARIKLEEFDLARSDLKEACTLDPKSREIREAYASVKEAEQAALREEVRAPPTGTRRNPLEPTGTHWNPPELRTARELRTPQLGLHPPTRLRFSTCLTPRLPNSNSLVLPALATCVPVAPPCAACRGRRLGSLRL